MTETAKGLRNELWLSISIIAIAIIAGSLLLYILSGDLSSESLKIASDKNAIISQTEELNEYAKLKSDSAASTQYLVAIQKLLPSHDALIGFQAWVNTVAAAHNVSGRVDFGSSVPGFQSTPTSDAFSLTMSGGESDIVAAIGDMETASNGFLISIDSFDLRANGAGYILTASGHVFSNISSS